MEVIMLYYFTYELEGKYCKKTCITLREAEIFFDVLISAGATSIKVLSIRKRGTYYVKK